MSGADELLLLWITVRILFAAAVCLEMPASPGEVALCLQIQTDMRRRGDLPNGFQASIPGRRTYTVTPPTPGESTSFQEGVEGFRDRRPSDLKHQAT